jgi:hypothetical protein
MPPTPSDIRVHGIYAVIPYLLGSTRIYRLIVINSIIIEREILRILGQPLGVATSGSRLVDGM